MTWLIKQNVMQRNLNVFLNFIEQGPRLENERKVIGVVTGIAAPIRAIVVKDKRIIQEQQQCIIVMMHC
ncbi:MAG: hypothetical protein ACLR5Y_02515 [Haemophilus parainfluenzae]